MSILKKGKLILELGRQCTRTISASALKEHAEEVDDMLFDSTEIVGIATLNKPKVLNAVNMSMLTKFYVKLQEWEKTKQFVISKGAGKAFCAGGDLLYLTAPGPDKNERAKPYFRVGYTEMNLIGTYAIPYVAIIDGFTMGAGGGLSIHGKYRIATERTIFAMPETTIGFHPDVGASYFLPRLRGKLGLFLGLTGHQLRGPDVAKVGLATHFIESSKLPEFYEKLTDHSTTAKNLDAVITKHTNSMRDHQLSLEPVLSKIDHCFSASSVEDIIRALEQDKSAWATKTLEIMKSKSPMALKVTKRAYDLGSRLSLQDCLMMEYRISLAMMDARVSKDFYEGVRALIIDKDKNPKWNPATLEEIDEDAVSKYFAPFANAEEELSNLRSSANLAS